MEGKRISIHWTTLALVLIIALAVPWAVWADQQVVDNDIVAPGNQNILNLTASPGATLNASGQILVSYQGSKHLVAGTTVNFAVNTSSTTLPSGYSVSSVNLTCPNPWTGGEFHGTSNFSFTAPTTPGSYSYQVQWDASGYTCQSTPCLTGNAGLTINLSVTAPTDTTPPVISYVLTPSLPDGNNGWYKSNVTLVWTVTENESPSSLVKTGCVDQNITADQLATTYSCSATSDGGSAGPVLVTIKRDATAPTISASVSPPRPVSGWWNIASGAPTVGFICSDATSGLAGSCPGTHTFGEGENQSHSQTIYDNAGNSNSAGVTDIDVDLTAPTFGGCPAGGPFFLGSGPQSVGPISVDAAISGPNAGASTLSGSVDTSSIGPKSVTFTAVDNAGNSATKSCSYSVIFRWTGFFTPVDNPPVVNVVKAGSAIPVKFNLDGYQGLGIFASGYPKVWTIACDPGAPQEPVDETVTAGQSSLTYDPVAGQYVYVWKTSKAWAGTCRQLEVKLIDGTSHFANFSFR